MNAKTLVAFPALIVSTIVVSGCSSNQKISDLPSATPPQLISTSSRDPAGKNVIVWDRPAAFGRVPSDKQILGDATCMRARVDLKAVGYHPQARDINGRPLDGGGFMCGVKEQGDKPAATPPRLVKVNGSVGWDQPAAFGAVPADLRKRGNDVCARLAQDLIAIAYHPDGRNETNTPIIGGAFFCASKN